MKLADSNEKCNFLGLKNPGKDHFVAHGNENLRSSEGYKQKKQEVEKRIYEEMMGDWNLTPWWKKPFLKRKMENRIQRELDLLAPPDALYLYTKK